MVIESVGKNIKAHRTAMNLAQIEFASKISLRLPTLSEIESGKKNPSYKDFGMICTNLDLPMDYLLKDFDATFKKFAILELYHKIDDKEQAKNIFSLLSGLLDTKE